MAQYAMLSGLRQGLRSLARSPLPVAMSILCLGLGMASTVVAFSIMNGLTSGDVPGISDRRTFSRVVLEMNWRGETWVGLVGSSARNFQRLQAHGPEITAVAAEAEQRFALRTGDDSVSVTGAFVSGNYFNALGTTPQLGRLLGPPDDTVDADAAVIGGALWRRHFGGSPDVLGQVLTINGRRFRVVGVAPDRFTGLELADIGTDVDDRQIWLPLALSTSWSGVDRDRFLRLAVRHASGVSREQAAQALNAIALEPHTAAGKPYPTRVALREHGYGPREMDLEAVAVMVAFLLPPFVVLAIACANVANFQLARAMSRIRDLAVRMSLGASPGQVVRLLALESAMLTAASAFVAWVTTELVLRRFAAFFPMAVAPDLTVAVFVVIVGVGTLFLSGVVPAWRVARALRRSGLRLTAQAGGRSHTRLRHALVGAQVALSIGLLTIGALSVRTLMEAHDRTAAVTDGLLIADFDLEQLGYDGRAATRFADALLERLRADARIEHAGVANARLFVEHEELYTRPGEAETNRQVAFVTEATPGWFDAMRIRMRRGRPLTDADRNTPVGVVNETLARRLEAGGGPAVGSSLRVRGFNHPAPREATFVEIVGVVSDAVGPPDRAGVRPAVYLPLPAETTLQPTLVVRSDNPERLIADVRRAVAQTEPRVPWAQIETGSSVLARQMSPVRYFALAIGGLGLLALVFATAGLYGVMLYATTLRTREIGIRIAVGAQQLDVVRLILRQALTVVCLGIVAGLILVVPISFTMRSLFVGVSPADPWSLGPTVLLLLGAGLIAAMLPALRASRIDPVRALKHD
jgi:predicted permease